MGITYPMEYHTCTYMVASLFREVEIMNLEERIARLEALHPEIAEQDAEQDAEQWVELNGYWRISTDGVKVQRRDDWWDDSDPWADTTEAPELVELYRTGLTHGREVAEADNVALRALVEEHEELKSKLQVRVAELEAALSASSSCCGCSVPFDEEDEDCGECRVAKMRVKALGGPTEIDPFRGGE